MATPGDDESLRHRAAPSIGPEVAPRGLEAPAPPPPPSGRGEARFIETRLSDPPALPPPPPSCRVSAAVCSQLSTAAGSQEAGPPARGEVASCRPCGVCSSACDKYK